MRTSTRRRCRALLVALPISLAGLQIPGQTAIAAVAPSRVAADYAIDSFADPWDFSNAQDFNVTPATQSNGVTNTSMGSGVLSFGTTPGGYLTLVGSHVPGGLPYGRDGSLYPIDASRYTNLSLRMYSSQRTPGGVLWFSCPELQPTCQGGFPFQVEAGWQTYSFSIPAMPKFGGSVAYSGLLPGLRLIPSGDASPSILIDWIRLHEAGASTTPTATPPLPELLNPDRAGGADYAETIRGDYWDYSQSTDAVGGTNVAYNVGGGLLDGVNTGPDPWDAQIVLPLGPTPIDGSRFNRLSMRIWYDGPFGLHEGAGGGMNARLIWLTQGSSAWQDSEDIVVYPGWNDIQVELATTPATRVNDVAVPVKLGWTGRQIVSLRVDPHEDYASRRFLIDNVRIAEVDHGTGGFPIQFRDRAWKSGTTADLYADTNGTGFNGTLIAANIPVQNGINTYSWNAASLPAGTYHVYVVMDDGTYESRRYATGPVRIDEPPSDPFGSLDSARQVPGGIQVSGWAADPNSTNPISVHAYVDGRFSGAVVADRSRPDVVAVTGGFDRRGFSFTAPAAAPGARNVCLYGINVGKGGNALLGCRSVSLAANPKGSLDGARRVPGGVLASGWGFDPDSGGPIDVHLYVDGVGAAVGRTGLSRPDIGKAFPGYGSSHGFATTTPVTAGRRSLCAYGINRGPGSHALLGCRSVDVQVNPFGSLDSLTRSGSTVRVAGWALDPDVAASIGVHVYVDGTFGGAVTASRTRSDLVGPYPGYGTAHGFDLNVSVGAGPHQVCVYGINAAAGGNAVLRCGTV